MAKAWARSEVPGIELKEPIEICLLEALVEGTGSDAAEASAGKDVLYTTRF
jgi:hypothetical protein